jgi:hypothetical protein
MIKAIAGLLLLLGLASPALAQSPTQCLVPANAGATPVVSASAEGSHVLKASPGCLLATYVYNSGAAAFLMVFNSKTVPADGAVTPIECIPVASASYQFINFAPLPPEWFSTGISVAISTTGCFTKTVGSGAFFHALVQ